MQTLTKHTIVAAIAGLLLVGAWAPAPLAAQDEPKAADDQQRQQTEKQNQQQEMPDLARANKLLEAPIYNDAGEKLGTLYEIVLNRTTLQISYAVLAYDAEGFDDKMFALPWSIVDVKKSDKEDQPYKLTVNLSKDRLKEAPGFDFDKWPTRADEGWTKAVDDYYQQRGQQNPDDAERRERNKGGQTASDQKQQKEDLSTPSSHEKFWMHQLSELVGMEVVTKDNEDLAELEDLIIDTKQGRVFYAMLSYGGTLGIDEKMVLVPWNALYFDVSEEVLWTNATKATLEENSFAQGELPEFETRDYGEKIHEQFDVEPMWQQPLATPRTDGRQSVERAWRNDSQYNKKYDAEKVKTIEGTIVSRGTFRPSHGASAGLRLRIMTEQGQIVTVHAGKKSHMREQDDISLRTGQKVSVQGSSVTFEGRSVLMARQITVDDKTITLRAQDGTPKWEQSGGQQDGAQQQGDSEKPQSEQSDN